MNLGDRISVPPDADSIPSQFNYSRLLFPFLLALFGLSIAWGAGTRRIGVDFYQFWVVAQTLDRPGVNIYSDEDRHSLGAEFLEKSRQTGNPELIAIAEYRQKLETYSSPFLYTMFRQFSTGDFDRDLRHYRLLLLACLCFSVIVIARVLKHPWEIALAAVAVFSAFFAPFSSDMRVANVGSLQLAALAIYLWLIAHTRWPYREIVGGVIFGFVIAFKPNLVFIQAMLALSWVFDRQSKRLLQHIIGALAGVTSAIVVASATFGSFRCWPDWISAVRTLPPEIISVAHGNFAPVRMLSERFGIDIPFAVAVIVGGMSMLAIWWNRRLNTTSMEPAARFDLRSDALAISLGCLVSILVPRLAWLHYYVLMIPVFLILLSPAYSHRFNLVCYVLIGVALLGYGFDSLGNIDLMPAPAGQSVLVVLATLILFGLTLADQFARCRRVSPAPPDRSRSRDE
jgi:hypothetical protein